MDIEQYFALHNITQITALPAEQLDDFVYPAGFSVVIGNNRYFGPSIDEAIQQAEQRVAA